MTRLNGRLPEWWKSESFVGNLLIGGSIALLIYFVEQTGVLQRFLNFIIYLLLTLTGSLLRYKYFHALSWSGIILDTGVVIAATLVWTAFRSFAARVLTNTLLFLLLIPVSLYIFNRYSIVISAVPIVLGIIMAITIDAAAELKKQSFRRKLAEEKQEAEFSVIRHLAHNVRPNLQIIRSPLTSIRDFLEREGLLDTELSRRLDGSAETVGEALQNAVTAIAQISAVIDNTRRLVTREIPHEEFVEINVKELLEREIFPLHAGRFALVVTGTPCRVKLHRNSFVEAVNNLIRNAEVHGFPEAASDDELRFCLKETRNSLVIDYTNNGITFPSNLTTREFLSFGVKSADSPGEGLGGAWVGKVIEAHGGTFEIIRDDNPVHFRINLPKEGH